MKWMDKVPIAVHDAPEKQHPLLCAPYDISADAYYQLGYAWCENNSWLFELVVPIGDYVSNKMNVAHGKFRELNHDFRNKFAQFVSVVWREMSSLERVLSILKTNL